MLNWNKVNNNNNNNDNNPNIFSWIDSFVAYTAAVNPNNIKAILANGLSRFPIKGNPVFSDGPKILPRNPLDCFILRNWVFDNFILADEPFAKALRRFETCLLVNNNLWEELFLSPATFEIFKVTSVPFFFPSSNLLSCELDNFIFKVLYWVL